MENLTPRGTRDFLPKDMILFNNLIDTIRKTYEKYGFVPLDTPVFEKLSVLTKKGGGGEEIKKEIYVFKDKNGRELGLRFDLTVPSARVVANNTSIKMPFKRYYINKVWRYNRPGKGRFREFWQSDIDIYGVEDMTADAECIACTSEALMNIGFKEFMILINDREILNEVVRDAGVPKENVISVFRAMDKLDKISVEGVKEELKKINLKEKTIKKILEILNLSGKFEAVLKIMKKKYSTNKGLKRLEELYKLLKYYDLKDRIVFDLSLVRGLEYYTGPIFEIRSTKKGYGSLGGGGRYDNLLKLYGKKSIPAVGFSIGIERVFSLMKELRSVKEKESLTNVFVAPIGKKMLDEAIILTQTIRDAGISTEYDLMGKSLSKQLEYASNKKIPFVIIVGEKDMKQNKVVVRDMRLGKDNKMYLADVINYLKENLRVSL